jgi:ribosomal protein L4
VFSGAIFSWYGSYKFSSVYSLFAMKQDVCIEVYLSNFIL